jgi:hypothetical protein
MASILPSTAFRLQQRTGRERGDVAAQDRSCGDDAEHRRGRSYPQGLPDNTMASPNAMAGRDQMTTYATIKLVLFATTAGP